jgi:hypothetical protein
MSPKPNRLRRVLIAGGLVAGSSLGAAGIATAATTSSTPAASASSSTAPTPPSSGTPPTGAHGTPPSGSAADPATLTHGPGETLLTGSDLAKATAAATAAVPGATVIRAETNSSGASPYEVHLKKSDGTDVTVELDSSFGVVATVPGFGAGPAGGQAPGGSSTAPPTAPSSASSSA